jgi:transcriptional regulator with XRE-family HTH domain
LPKLGLGQAQSRPEGAQRLGNFLDVWQITLHNGLWRGSHHEVDALTQYASRNFYASSKKAAPVSDSSDVIRAIRKRRCMSMASFAKFLGISQGQVSRYESGQAVPGYRVLLHLLNLADGVEKNPILDLLKQPLGYDNKQPTGSEALRELEELGQSLVAASGLPPDRGIQPDTPTWDRLTDLWPNLGEVLKLTHTLYSRRREVDPSLVQFLRLWLSNNDMDPSVNQCFGDAVLYLEFLLTKRARIGVGSRSKKIDPRSDVGTQSTHAATFPFDLPDEDERQQGRVVELDILPTKHPLDMLLPAEPAHRSKKRSK